MKPHYFKKLDSTLLLNLGSTRGFMGIYHKKQVKYISAYFSVPNIDISTVTVPLYICRAFVRAEPAAKYALSMSIICENPSNLYWTLFFEKLRVILLKINISHCI